MYTSYKNKYCIYKNFYLILKSFLSYENVKNLVNYANVQKSKLFLLCMS